MVGRRQSMGNEKARNTPVKADANVDSLRDFFDQKVADVSRREHLAMKLAQEWEEHLDLTTQRDELLQNSDVQEESVQALESQINFREARIRQLASRLGKRERLSGEESTQGVDAFLFDKKFKQVVGNIQPDSAAKIAAKVLFGMVVRERRRIAALARTASKLDEKVQEAEASSMAKDAAFRSYVDEQRLEAAALAQNQQEHILSLMEMVKESPANESIEYDDYSLKKIESHSSESSNSKLLVLANERIAVLERQLNEISLGRDAVQKHREREEAALSVLEEKKKECEDLEEDVDDLRSALRRIREELARGGIGPGISEDSESIPTIQTVQDILANALHPSSGSVGSCSKRRRTSTSMMGHSPSLAPSIKRETYFMHSSDSDEMPDWAEDIMADLAVIAEGKMPSSLMQSKEVLAAESHLSDNVFDRLNNPVSFTGVQKQRNASNLRSGRSRSNSEGQKQRKMISMQVADSLNKVTIPGTKEKKKEAGRKPKETRSSKSEAEKRSVFDRLLSPSNLTGTQKQKFAKNRGRNLEKAIQNDHVSLRGRGKNGDYDSDCSEGLDAENLLDELLVNSRDSHNPSKLNDYKQIDVFERLNKTTTQAYAVKQNTNIAEKMLDDVLNSSDSDSEEHEDAPKGELRFERLEEYASQNVFERLQRTTTEAYAKKANISLSEDALHRSNAVHSSPDLSSPTKAKMERNNLVSPSNTVSGSSPKQQKQKVQKKTAELHSRKKNSPVE